MQLLGRLFGFQGRIGQGAFWLLALPWLLILAAMQFVRWTLLSPPPAGFGKLVYDTVAETTVGIVDGNPPLIPTLVLIVAFLMFLSAVVRRLHDLGRTGALALVIFAPALILLARLAAERILGIDFTLWLTPQNPPIFYGFMAGITLLVLWGWVLLAELGFRRGRRSADEFRLGSSEQVTPQLVPLADYNSTTSNIGKIARLIGFRGRIGRGAFWLLSAPWLLFLVTYVTWMIYLAGAPGTSEATFKGIAGGPFTSWLLFIAVLLMLLLFVSAAVRRLHDLQRSGLLVLVFFLPPLVPISIFAMGLDVRWLGHPIVAFGNIALYLWGLVLLVEMAFRRGRRRPLESPQATQEQIAPQIA